MRARLAIAVCASIVAVGCSGGGTRRPGPAPTTAAVTVLPSADRIRLGQIRVGGPPGCLDDEFCAAGLSRVYGLDLGGGVVAQTDPAATIGLLDAGAIDIGVIPRYAAHGADPASAAGGGDIFPLTDDRHLAPPRNVIPVITPGVVALAHDLDAVSAQLDAASIDQVEQGLAAGGSPESVAATWLGAHFGATTAPPQPPGPGFPTVALGVEAGPEPAALADIYAGGLSAAGVPVQLVPLDGGAPDALDAFAAGRISIAIDTVDALVGQLTGFGDPHPSIASLRSLLADRGLTTTAPARGGPGYVWTLSPAVAKALPASSLSDVARAGGIHLAPPSPTTTTPAPAATTVAAAAPLGIGDHGAAVLALQERLLALGYAALRTARFDEETRRAVVAFQIDQGLIDTGETNAATQRALAVAHPTDNPATPPTPRTDPGAGTGVIYLVFADGPSPATPAVVQALNRRSASATFLMNDAAINRHPDILRTIAAPNGVGLSEPPHDASSSVGEDALQRTAARAREDLAARLGRTPACFLAPYGATARADGLKTVLWDVDPQDWRRPGADVIAADVIDNARAGSVVLLHDGGGDRSQTVAALPTILDTLEGRGYTFAALPECIA